MEYELSQHASEVILEREIQVEWIDQTLNNPILMLDDPEDGDLRHHFARIKDKGNRVLRVVFNKELKPIRIVTVYFDRTMKGKL